MIFCWFMLCDPTLICQIPVVFFYIINFFTWFLDFLFKPFVIINWRSACEVLIKLCAGIAIERLPKVWIIQKKSGNQEGHSVMDHQRCVFWWFFIPLMWPPISHFFHYFLLILHVVPISSPWNTYIHIILIRKMSDVQLILRKI